MGKFEIRPDFFSDLLDGSPEVAAGNIGLNDDFALYVLATDVVRPAILPNHGNHFERDGPAGRSVDERLAD